MQSIQAEGGGDAVTQEADRRDFIEWPPEMTVVGHHPGGGEPVVASPIMTQHDPSLHWRVLQQDVMIDDDYAEEIAEAFHRDMRDLENRRLNNPFEAREQPSHERDRFWEVEGHCQPPQAPKVPTPAEAYCADVLDRARRVDSWERLAKADRARASQAARDIYGPATAENLDKVAIKIWREVVNQKTESTSPGRSAKSSTTWRGRSS